MQLLHILDTDDFAAWKTGFDGRMEDRMRAGLTLMQMWHGDAPNRVVCLYEVNDRAKAEAWLAKGEAMQAGVSASSHHFLRTV